MSLILTSDQFYGNRLQVSDPGLHLRNILPWKPRMSVLSIETRMHSSRMRTGRSLTVYWSVLPSWGGSAPGGGLLPGGSASQGGGCLLRGWGSTPGGFSLPRGGVCTQRGCLLRGVSSWGGQFPGGSALGGFSLPVGCLLPGGSPCPETPPVNRITHTCKNITLATTSLRPVIKEILNR